MEENEHGEVIEEVQTTELKAAKLSEAELRAELERIKAEVEQNKSKSNSGKIVMIMVIIVVLATLGAFGIMAMRDVMGGKNKDKGTSNSATTSATVSGQAINLSEHSDDVSITAGGEYVLTGEIGHSVIVDSLEDVTLKLNGVKITSAQTAAIASVGQGALTIEIVEGTENTLSDGGESDYDGCIFSAGPLTINGNGTLNVYGRQTEGEGIATESNSMTINSGTIYVESADDGLNAGGDGGTITINGGLLTIKAGGDGIDSNKDLVINGGTVYAMGSAAGGNAGIDTDGGYVINGGTVMVLGSDMLEAPLQTSKQNVVVLSLSNAINSGTEIALVDADGGTVITFTAQENFRTLVLSSEELVNGTYQLQAGGAAVTIDGATSFAVNNTITTVGSSMMGGPGGMMR